MMTLKEWLAKYGSEPCDGCFYNIPHRARCTYKKGYCKRYDDYRKDEKERVERVKAYANGPGLFD